MIGKRRRSCSKGSWCLMFVVWCLFDDFPLICIVYLYNSFVHSFMCMIDLFIQLFVWLMSSFVCLYDFFFIHFFLRRRKKRTSSRLYFWFIFFLWFLFCEDQEGRNRVWLAFAAQPTDALIWRVVSFHFIFTYARTADMSETGFDRCRLSQHNRLMLSFHFICTYARTADMSETGFDRLSQHNWLMLTLIKKSFSQKKLFLTSCIPLIYFLTSFFLNRLSQHNRLMLTLISFHFFLIHELQTCLSNSVTLTLMPNMPFIFSR